MLKARGNNVLSSRFRSVFVDGRRIRVANRFGTRTWCEFPSDLEACCSMAHIWSLCKTLGGMTIGEVSRELDNWRDA